MEDDDGNLKMGAGGIRVAEDFLDLCLFGMYPWKRFRCVRSDAGSHDLKVHSVESVQRYDFSSMLTNKY